MNKLLIICGSTATGKTNLALVLAKKYNGELVSADSRQVYKGFRIITGQDLPSHVKASAQKLQTLFRNISYTLPAYDVNGTLIWMYDVMTADEEFSVAHYQALGRVVIDDIKKREKLPIVAGGTGLYINSLVDTIDTIGIPRNDKLRKQHELTSVVDLQRKLQQVDPAKWDEMNNSDRHNPRRLTRALEVISWVNKHSTALVKNTPVDTLWIGLKLSQGALGKNIRRRIEKQIRGGALLEVKDIDEKQLSKFPLYSSLGISAIQDFHKGRLSKDELITVWTKQDLAYAKRQMVWFKKQKNIHWFNADAKDTNQKIEDLVRQWYT